MKLVLAGLIGLSIFALRVQAQVVSQDQIEGKVRADLDSILSKMLEPNQYSVQVSAQVERVNERQMVEGEQITQPPPAQREPVVPPLPGFNPPLSRSPETAPTQMRQVFRTVEHPVLRGLSVSLTLDQGLSSDELDPLQNLVRSYLNNSYPNLVHLSVQRAAMRRPAGTINKFFAERSFADALGLIALLVFACLVVAIIVFLRGRRTSGNWPGIGTPRNVSPETDGRSGYLNGDVSPLDHLESLRTLRALPSAPERAPERAAFAGVPANATYADSRRQLLDEFLRHTTVFRLYFQKLDEAARAEICSALTGPAFDTLVESLKLVRSELVVQPPSEEQLQFYVKNFSEFQEALRWQEQQFFGFLPHLTEEQLTALLQSQSPVVGALILKFCNAEISATVLERLSEERQTQIVYQFERTREISADELRTIEQSVRASVATLPNFILSSSKQEVDYWSRLLIATSDPQKLLSTIERARPDLYEKLARFRFQLEDLASLPPPLVRQVIEQVENDELARAMSRLPQDLVGHVLTGLPEARRRLLESQIVSYHNVDNTEVRSSVHDLTKKFREVLA